jgi:hypothetical protein
MQSLSRKLGRQQCHAGHVATRVAKAGYQAVADRIGHGRHHDGNRAGRSLGGTDCRCGRSDADLRVELYQLGRQGGQPVLLAGGPPVVDEQVAAFDIAELAQSLKKGFVLRDRTRSEVQIANAMNLAVTLRPRGERLG